MTKFATTKKEFLPFQGLCYSCRELEFPNISSNSCNTIVLAKLTINIMLTLYLGKGHYRQLLITESNWLFLFQDGNTPLHIAAKLGNIETLKALLSAGANPTIINDVSRLACNTPCIYACMPALLSEKYSQMPQMPWTWIINTSQKSDT